MRFVFVSNYINHHQIPFCRAMYHMDGVTFFFIQTEPMEAERVQMGWQVAEELPFLKLYYEEEEACKKLIADSDVVLFGGCDDERYIVERLRAGKPVIRYSERLYKEAQWKAISPRGLIKKYKDHGQYRKAPVYLLCAGAYVADDFHIIRSYPGKMYRWGYFPEKREYDLVKLFAGKGYYKAKRDGEKKEESCDRIPYLLWAGRFIDWKHPELAVQAAKYLKEQGISFHLDMVGGGEMEDKIHGMIDSLGLAEEISLPGFKSPAEVREMMERADIYLVTSDRKEGWGAVVNEAMNSGCAVVADHMIGAAPYLIRQRENGILYQDGKAEQLVQAVADLAKDGGLRRRLGENAYRTITEVWNAENAAKCLMKLITELKLTGFEERNGGKTLNGHPGDGAFKEETVEARASHSVDETALAGPCTPAPVIPERKMYGYLTKARNG